MASAAKFIGELPVFEEVVDIDQGDLASNTLNLAPARFCSMVSIWKRVVRPFINRLRSRLTNSVCVFSRDGAQNVFALQLFVD